MDFIKWLLTLAMSVFVGCGGDCEPPRKEEVVGMYMGKYANGIEVIEIGQSGSFSQEFQIGSKRVYASEGKWEMEGAVISFRPFVFPSEMLRTNDGSFHQRVDVAPGQWARNPVHIEFGPWPYHVAKVSGEGAQVLKSAFEVDVKAKNPR